MNKKIEHRKYTHPKRMNPIFKLFISIMILMPFLLCAKVSAASLPTITGYRTYTYCGTQSSNGINGGNQNGIIPFNIIDSPPTGCNYIFLNTLTWEFAGSYGNAQNQYNKATVSFLLVQPSYQGYSKTWNKQIAPIASARTNKGNMIQTVGYFPSENNDSLVIQFDFVSENYESFTNFYFTWGGGTYQLAMVGLVPGGSANYNSLTMSIGDIQIISTADPMIAGQNQIINQNNTIINQNQQMITGMGVQNQLIQNQNDELQGVQDKAQQESQRGNQGANDAETENQQASTNIFGIVTKVVGTFTNAPNGNCVIPVVASGVDLGNIDLCSGKPPIWGQIVGGVVSIILVYACFKTALFIFQWFISLTAFAQGGGWNKGGDE